MTLEALMQAERRIAGVKQAEKAVAKDNALGVYIAADADERVTAKLRRLCRDKGVEVVCAGSMAELGQACGIHVKAAAAAILNH